MGKGERRVRATQASGASAVGERAENLENMDRHSTGEAQATRARRSAAADIIIGTAFALAAIGCARRPEVVTYAAPAGEADASQYRVEVEGRPVDVYAAQSIYHDKRYDFASFDFSGRVRVRIRSAASLANARILPESSGIAPVRRSDTELEFAADRPFRVSIERDGENSPLLLFGNPPERDAPKPGDPGVVYFGPGVHEAGKIELISGQTLYLAGGAVVRGGVVARGDNISIRGRGILDGNGYSHFRGPTTFMVHLEKCRNAVVRDIVIRGSWLFTIAPCGCEGVTVDNVKLCGSRVHNDDGFDIINSSDVTIRDCFLRTDDDCVAVKGLRGYDRKACERITITGCSFWTERANIFRIGYESEAEAMRDLAARDVDVIHFVDNRPPEQWWPNCVFLLHPSDGMPMERLRFEDVRVDAGGARNVLVRVLPEVCEGLEHPDVFGPTGWFKTWPYKEPGRYVRDCLFRDIRVAGKAGTPPGAIFVAGADAKHPVDGVSFENVIRFGRVTTVDSPDVKIGPHARNVKFLDPK